MSNVNVRQPVWTGMNFEQTEAQDTWLINHNFGYNPNVQIFIDVDGMMTSILPSEINHIDGSNVEVKFSRPRAGKARLI